MSCGEDYFTISVQDIQKDHEEKTRQRLEIYKKLLDRCFKYIKNCADQEQTRCFFRVPQIMWGLPIYKMQQCMEFMMMKLKEKGFKCSQIQKTNTIYISWNLRKPNMKLLEYRPASEQPARITSQYVPRPLMDQAPLQNNSNGGNRRKPREIDMMPIRTTKTINFDMPEELPPAPAAPKKRKIKRPGGSVYQYKPSGRRLY